jgi:hypothetical protein
VTNIGVVSVCTTPFALPSGFIRVWSHKLPFDSARWLAEAARFTVKVIGAVRVVWAVGAFPNCNLRVGIDLLPFAACFLYVAACASVGCIILVLVIITRDITGPPPFGVAAVLLIFAAGRLGVARCGPMTSC